MKQRSWWSIPIVAVGSGVAVAATLLHHMQAYRAGVPGGYLVFGLGTLSVGVLAGVGTYFTAPATRRAIQKAAAVTVGVSLATAGVLLATLIWAFGS